MATSAKGGAAQDAKGGTVPAPPPPETEAPVPEDNAAAEAQPPPPPELDAVPNLADDQLREFWGLRGSLEESADMLSKALGYRDYRVDAQQSIRLDFAMFVLQFAHGHALTCPQTRAVMKASHAFLHRIQSEPNLDAIQEDLKNMLMPMVKAAVSADEGFLLPEQLGAFGRFLVDLVVKHFHLWRFVLTMEQEHDYTAEDITVETPNAPVEFDKVVVTEEQWFRAKEQRVQAEEDRKKREVLLAQEKAMEQDRLKHEEERKRAEEQIEQLKQAKPASLDEAVEIQVRIRLEEERLKLIAEFQAKEDEIREEIKGLAAKLAASLNPPPAAPAAPHTKEK